MNEDEFADFLNSKDPDVKSKKVTRDIIDKVTGIFNRYVNHARTKYPNVADDIAVGTTPDGLGATLTVFSSTLRYVFSNDTIIVWFNNDKADLYTFDGTNMISEKHKHPFELSDVEQELNNFK